MPNKNDTRKFLVLTCLLALGALFALVGNAQNQYETVISSPIRSDKDRSMDATRKPSELLQFSKVQPGWRVMDVFTGGGFTTQLMALAVTERGKVYAQSDRPSKAIEQRLALNPQSNIEFVLRPMDDLVPAGVENLDLVTLINSYHDISYFGVDRLEMDRKIYAALKIGGYLIVADHTAQPGSGLRDTKTLHRIDPQTVLSDFLSVGFKLDEQANFLKNPMDPLDIPSSKVTPSSDTFIFRFIK
jgi:predicted methyltransferase